MVFMKLFTGLGPLDARSIGRDSLLRWMLALPLLIVVPVRLVLPPLLVRIGLTFGLTSNCSIPVLPVQCCCSLPQCYMG